VVFTIKEILGHPAQVSEKCSGGFIAPQAQG